MRWSETLVLIRSDLDRLRSAINEGNAAPGRIRTLILLLTPESFSLALYRLSHYFRQRGWHRAAAFLYRLNLTLTGLDIHPDTRIGPGCLVVHPVGGQHLPAAVDDTAVRCYRMVHQGRARQRVDCRLLPPDRWWLRNHQQARGDGPRNGSVVQSLHADA